MPHATGDILYIRAQVQQVYHADRGDDWESYGLKLADGQYLQTSVKNIRGPKEAATEAEADRKLREAKDGEAAALTQPATRHKAVVGPKEEK